MEKFWKISRELIFANFAEGPILEEFAGIKFRGCREPLFILKFIRRKLDQFCYFNSAYLVRLELVRKEFCTAFSI